MAEARHDYRVTLEWTGNRGAGTKDYNAYGREYEIRADGKLALIGSADPAFRGDKALWNPEDLLVASLSACHQLWYLHLCADAGIVVTEYKDEAEGVMAKDDSGVMRFLQVTLNPKVTVTHTADIALAGQLHENAHARCFIANSVNFPIDHTVTVTAEDD